MTVKSRLLTGAGVLLFVLGLTTGASARYAHPLTHETTRTQGMGGASVAVADDQQALWINPAGLGQITDKGYAVLDVHGEMNQDFRRVENKTDGLSDKDTPENRSANHALLSDVMGQRARLLASNLAYYLGGTGFGGGFLYQSLSEIRVQNPVSPRIHVYGDVDSVLSGSVARPIRPLPKVVFNDQAQGWWGLSLKFLSRRSIDQEFDARDFAGLSESDLRRQEFKGTTFDFDGGVLYQLKNPWFSSVGLHVANLFETEIDPTIGQLKRQVAIGTAIRPLSGPVERKKKLLLAADLWDVTGEGTFMNRLRLGLEVSPRPWLKIRGGVRGGYLTAGATAEFREAWCEFATYSEEIGPRPGDREDRRYSLTLGFEF